MGCEVVAVSFEPLPHLQEFANRERLPFPVLSDPGRRAYQALGLQEGPSHRIFGLATIWTYVRSLFQGRWPRVPRANVLQLGGDVIIDANGIIAFLYKSRDPADRPPVAMLLDAVRRSIQKSSANTSK